MNHVRVVRAWPGRHEEWTFALDSDATVADALAAVGLARPMALEAVAGYAIYGIRVHPSTRLHDGDRLELLDGLKADPKDARRRRAAASRGSN